MAGHLSEKYLLKILPLAFLKAILLSFFLLEFAVNLAIHIQESLPKKGHFHSSTFFKDSTYFVFDFYR